MISVRRERRILKLESLLLNGVTNISTLNKILKCSSKTINNDLRIARLRVSSTLNLTKRNELFNEFKAKTEKIEKELWILYNDENDKDRKFEILVQIKDCQNYLKLLYDFNQKLPEISFNEKFCDQQ